MYNQTRTVAAISTGQAPGGIGVVRISGPQALAVGERVFRARSGRPLPG
ncbi:MAG: tRNA uridine-5-carboxymethylaminomethyl(34) synthesis GTPase MnmE, partial [Acutalibacter sp.]|nr:tRNA uridine-5-carboxymethylaminomethyl(34) synthesis GTPase MnmE [Acutalibacter sp.]